MMMPGIHPDLGNSSTVPRDAFQNIYGSIHHTVTGGLLYLLDGMFQNIEHALHDIARRPEAQKQRCSILMREIKAKRSTLIHLIAERMQKGFDNWLGQRTPVAIVDERISETAQGLANKSAGHFGPLLKTIAERSADAVGTDSESRMPINPYHISSAFLESCRDLHFDAEDTAILAELFQRYVLDRLGHIYGECNERLRAAGHLTRQERVHQLTD